MSCPGVSVKVKRAKKIFLQFLDEQGETKYIEAEKLLAVVFQHEIDHLLGKLIIDYAPFWKRASLKKKIANV